MKGFPNERCVEIIDILLNSKKPVTVSKIANKLNVSNRTIRNDLGKLEDYFEDDENIKLQKKPRVGVWLEVNKEGERRLKARAIKEKNYVKPFSSEKRKIYIIKRLLKTYNSITMKDLANELYVSRITIYKDLENVEKWLNKFNLGLKRKQNYGIEIIGKEKDWRRAAVELLAYLKNDEELKNMLTNTEEVLETRLGYENFIQLKELFPNIKLKKIEKILEEAETKMEFLLADEGFINLLVHISISVERLKQNKDIQMSKQQLESIKSQREFEIAKEISQKLEKEFNIQIPESEIGYIALHILGSKVQKNIKPDEAQDILKNADKKLIELGREIISLIENILSVDFSKDKKLLTGLVLHLRPAINRLKYGLSLKNNLLEDIKTNYPSVFGAAWATSALIEKYYGVKVTEEEIGYIAIHVGAALERLNNNTRAVIVCGSGIGTAQLVAIRLEKEIKDLEIIDVVSAHDLEKINPTDFDIIVSTIPIKYKSKPTIQINPLVNESDIEKIKKYIRNVQNTKRFSKDVIENKTSELFSEDLILQGIEVKNKEEVIEKLGNILLNKGYVNKDFIKNVLEREKVTSTAVGKGVAIPHGNPETIKRPSIAIATLKEPIDWSGNRVDIVFLLALKSEKDDILKKFFRRFYNMLDNEKVLEKIKNSIATKQIYNILTQNNNIL
ncbi:BglG family transcription antiterminator [Thermohalobacter berrensis]|uniref:Transcriptional antiterminator BglG n=1 Tax=Thermohalobacter berrensis TaxID=99594 RepID=A0A419T9R0_9FIRM|nr:BglG family transcription antiterminator [Thermohalobacter berrensis]RKD34209.1 transcriptional antiterminator BglG [Thermohalobacter berrensis]